MPTYLSPGVYLLERDFSGFVAPTSTTALGLVITAQKGPMDQLTLVTSEDQFIRIFGYPDAESFGGHAAINYLQKGNQLWAVRVAKKYAESAALIDTLGAAAANGRIYTFVAEAGHGFTVTPATYLKITEPGRASTFNAKVTNVSTNTITIDIPLNDLYTENAVIAVSDTPEASTQAEIFAMGRRNNIPYRLVKFTAKDPGDHANFGTNRGIEVVIEDGGHFANLDPVTGNPITSDGIELQGVQPSSPSVDNKRALLSLPSPVDGETRGVNYDSLAVALTDIDTSDVNATGTITFTILPTNGQQVVVGAKTYTLVNTLASANDVKIEAGLPATVSNLIAASVAGAGSGTAYHAGTTANAQAAGAAGATALMVNLTAITAGAAGNSIATTTTVTGATVTAATLTGGGTITTLTVDDSTGFEVGGEFHVIGSTGWDTDADTPYEITGVPNGTSIVIEAPLSPPVDENGIEAWVDSATGHHFGTVYRYDADDEVWEAQGVLTKRVRVFYAGNQVEVFDNLIAYDSSSPNYWDTAINDNSDYIEVEYIGSAVIPGGIAAPGGDAITVLTSGEQPINTYNSVKHPYNPKLVVGTNDFQVRSVAASSGYSVYTFINPKGFSGSSPDSADYIGTIGTDQTKTGLQLFRAVETVDIAMLAVPGVSTASVVQEIISICNFRHDCLGIPDCPMGLTPQGVVDWHNGTGPYLGSHSAFVSNCVAFYYPWVKQFSAYTRTNLFLPPSCIIPAVIAQSDEQGESWFAAAGVQRGRVEGAIGVETIVNRGDMDFFYGPGNGNAINPIVQFAKDGVVVYGNRTAQRYASKLSQISVRRGLFYFEKNVIQALHRLVFEQNDPILWAQIRNLIQPYIRDMVGRRGLERGVVICDASTNPPEVRDTGVCRIKVYLWPISAAEQLELEVTVMNGSVSISETLSSPTQA